jgi:hypothetical protein
MIIFLYLPAVQVEMSVYYNRNKTPLHSWVESVTPIIDCNGNGYCTMCSAKKAEKSDDFLRRINIPNFPVIPAKKRVHYHSNINSADYLAMQVAISTDYYCNIILAVS